MECRENGVLLQATTKKALEYVIMKEKSARFRLSCTSPTLDSNMHNDLGPSVEGPLANDILTSQEKLCIRPEVQEIFDLFRNSQHEPISPCITTEQWIEH